MLKGYERKIRMTKISGLSIRKYKATVNSDEAVCKSDLTEKQEFHFEHV